jgi:hypothetical protein
VLIATEHASIHATGVTFPPPSHSSALDFAPAVAADSALAMAAMATAVIPKQRSNFTMSPSGAIALLPPAHPRRQLVVG